jgi:hypothetical protein
MRRTISVGPAGESRYHVTVEEDGARTEHDVTASPADLARYGPGVKPDRLLEASFEFLLEREPKEAILRRFDLPAIERYFPEYPRKIRDLLQNR